ncbi:MAG: hypothetical protein IJR02_09565 [Bacteroidaceae bacterium]|nr:hypothetical protein [Bacteroidaceae bacterium]
MNTQLYKWLTGSAMAASLMVGFTACSDDHFDITSEAAGKQTIWQNIQANSSQLSEYADILQSVYYSPTEGKTTPETYANLLDGDQTFTVWAPVNGSFRYSYYKGLLQTGVRDSIYKVEKELIRNNMTRYSHVVNGSDSVKLDLFNSKAAWLNNEAQTIKGVTISTPNIGAKNGVLHITKAPMAYQPNLYEYLASRQDLDSINAFIKSFQTIEFNEAASTQGPTIDGEITWVDSITYVANDYTSLFMEAFLEREDSNYVMILPTNETWKNTLEKTRKYFKFKASYKQDINTQTEAGADTVIAGVETVFTPAELDSLTNLYSKNAICQHLAFNANWQYEQIPVTSIADIRAADARRDSLRSTADMKFKKTGTLNGTNKVNAVEVKDFAALFGNADPVEVSNGYAYVVDEFAYPSTVYAPNRDLDSYVVYESCDNQCAPYLNTWTWESHVTMTDTVTGEVIAERDSTYRYDYLVMANKTSTSHPGAFFQLPNVLSCKYDIYVVIGYNTDYQMQNKFRAYISYDTEDRRVANEALKNPNEDAVDAKDASLYEGNYFVNRKPTINDDLTVNYTDTICIAKDFEFPVSYYGLSKTAYPVLQLKSNFTSSERNLYSREIWVNAIILKAKEQ